MTDMEEKYLDRTCDLIAHFSVPSKISYQDLSADVIIFLLDNCIVCYSSITEILNMPPQMASRQKFDKFTFLTFTY